MTEAIIDKTDALSDLLLFRREKLETILRSATPLLLEGYSTTPGSDLRRKEKLGVQTKSSPRDLVTIYDKKVEDYLTLELNKEFPGEKVIGEESVALQKTSTAERSAELESFWLVDPIDGTTNYSRAYPFFCTTAAYVERKENSFEVVVGAVWDPLRKEMFSASKGGGAWLNGQQLHTTNIEKSEEALVTTGFASERHSSGAQSFELFKRLTKLTLGVRRDGSAALDLSYVAAGRIDAYWEWGLAPWDIAAGKLLVSEAGGQVTDLHGAPQNLMSGEILVSNRFLHKWLVDRIKECGNESA